MSDNTAFSDWLKSRRKALDLTQEDLAERVGCSVWTIRKIEMGGRRPSRQIAELLAHSLRIPEERRNEFISLGRSGKYGEEQEGEIDAAVPSRERESAPQLPNNLPTPPTPLVGREAEVATLHERLADSKTRILTLTGPPGIGKTRLAIETAAYLLRGGQYKRPQEAFRDGLFFVSLAPITDTELVAATVARALNLKESSGQSAQAALVDHLRHKNALIVLDNFEQVVNAAHLIAELVSSCSGVKTLITSREALHLRGEIVFSVPTLALPDPNTLADHNALAHYSAVELFIDRAQAVSDFRLTEDNAKVVVELCARLDGLPLAIELLAARSRLLPPHALLTRLTKAEDRTSIQLVAGKGRDLPPRHQTLHAAISWSFDLLDEGEKQLFRRLGVFVGGFTVAAVEAVCNAEGELLLDTLDGFELLLDKSLIRPEQGGKEDAADMDPRFGMLETLRDYALEQLEEQGEQDAVRLRHAEYFLALAESAEAELRGPKQREWLDRLDRDHANLRSAIVWASENGREEIGLRLAGALSWYWFVRGYLAEGRQKIDATLALSDASKTEAARHDREYLELRLKAFRGAGILAHTQGNFSASRDYFTGCVEISRELGDNEAIANQLNSLGNVARAQGEYAEAQMLQEESLAMHRALNNKHGIAATLNNLGNVLTEQGSNDAARPYLEESVSIYRELGDKISIATASNSLGSVLLAQGDKSGARAAFETGLSIRQELGDKVGIALGYYNLGSVAYAEGDYREAYRSHLESLGKSHELGNKRGIVNCLEGLAKVSLAEGDSEKAARLLGSAGRMREVIGSPLTPDLRVEYNSIITILRETLGETRFAAVWAEGQNLPLPDLIAHL